MGAAERVDVAFTIIEGGMSEDERRKRRLDSMLEVYLEHQSEMRTRGLTLELLFNKQDELAEAHREARVATEAWQRAHEEKDEARIGRVLDLYASIDKRLSTVERATESVDKLESKFDELEDTQTRLRIDELNKALVAKESEAKALRDERAALASGKRHSDPAELKIRREETRALLLKIIVPIAGVVALALSAALGRCSALGGEPPAKPPARIVAPGAHS